MIIYPLSSVCFGGDLGVLGQVFSTSLQYKSSCVEKVIQLLEFLLKLTMFLHGKMPQYKIFPVTSSKILWNSCLQCRYRITLKPVFQCSYMPLVSKPTFRIKEVQNKQKFEFKGTFILSYRNIEIYFHTENTDKLAFSWISSTPLKIREPYSPRNCTDSLNRIYWLPLKTLRSNL